MTGDGTMIARNRRRDDAGRDDRGHAARNNEPEYDSSSSITNIGSMISDAIKKKLRSR